MSDQHPCDTTLCFLFLQVMFVFLSRTATGSSARFSSAAAAVYLLMQAELRAAAVAGGASPTARVRALGKGGPMGIPL